MKKIILTIFVSLIFTITVSADTNVRFFKTIEYEDDSFETIEIEASEFNYYKNNEIALMNNEHTTAYKRIEILADQSTITLKVNWVKLPTYSSYDVIAVRGDGVRFYNGTIKGTQSYHENNTNQIINYNRNSNNTKIFDNGVGISMNLVDGASDYELTLEVGYYKTSNSGTVYGSYQHAQRNVSLNQSQNYSLSASGLGGVIDFSTSVRNYYDGMGGVSISI